MLKITIPLQKSLETRKGKTVVKCSQISILSTFCLRLGGHLHPAEDFAGRDWLIVHLSNIRTFLTRSNDFGI